MELFDHALIVKPSTIPNSGKGLFTTVAIPKGSKITEYTGKVTTWKSADHDEGRNAYIYYVNRNYVIDGKGSSALAQFANDGRGFKKIKGINNNSEYMVERKRVFIIAKRNIEADEEILVAYGQDYWDVIKKNGIM